MNRLILKSQNALINNIKQKFSIVSNTHVSKDTEVRNHISRINYLKNIQLSITLSMLSLSVQEEPDLEQLLDL